MARKQQKSAKHRLSSGKRRIKCTKSHGHLVCWITSNSSPSKKHILLNFIIPGTHNNYRPHLIRRSSLLFFAFLLVGLQLTYNYFVAQRQQILGYATNVSSQAVIDAVNNSRSQEGHHTLTTDPLLSHAASLKANDMLTKDYWSHNAPDGTQPWHWFEMAGYTYQSAGENLAKDFMTSNGVVKAWLNSPSHRENMLSDKFENIGIAAVNGSIEGEETTLVVAMFGTKRSVLGADTENDTGTVSVTSSQRATILENPAQISSLTSPVSIITLIILISVLLVALLTHWHYIKLPKKIRKSWYRHHAFYTAVLALTAIIYVAYIFTSGTI